MAEQHAISVENLSKSYRIGADRAKLRKRQLGTAVLDILARPLRQIRQGAAIGKTEEFWALADVSFDVPRGQVLGIIGQNGAGKSTLLKILSRITWPTKGRAVLNGHVASLLEVGTGFHPELTGRENVYLNGAILGMRHREIKRKFDAIAEFSGVQNFLDTPVKRYSSGMRVRLAFAVAAHLDPEILLIDEVLAVGDLEFQNRCLGKMHEVAKEGRTVLFVSHNMAAVQNLCSRGIVLRNGRVVCDAPVNEAVSNYLSFLAAGAEKVFDKRSPRTDESIYLTGARILDEHEQPADRVVAGKAITLEFDYRNPSGGGTAHAFFTIFNQFGVAVTHCSTTINGRSFRPEHQGIIQCCLPRLPLPLGQYRVGAALHHNGRETDVVENCLVFEVASSVFYETGRTAPIQYAASMWDYGWKHIAASSFAELSGT